MRLKNVKFDFRIVNFVLLFILLVLVIILFTQRKTDKEYFNDGPPIGGDGPCPGSPDHYCKNY